MNFVPLKWCATETYHFLFHYCRFSFHIAIQRGRFPFCGKLRIRCTGKFITKICSGSSSTTWISLRIRVLTISSRAVYFSVGWWIWKSFSSRDQFSNTQWNLLRLTVRRESAHTVCLTHSTKFRTGSAHAVIMCTSTQCRRTIFETNGA